MIETQRLYIKPLTYQQLIKYAKCDNSLEEELMVTINARTISPELQEAIHQTFLPRLKDKPTGYHFSTLWTAISKADNKMVADLCLVDEPNAAGEIEIGYGTYSEFQGKGFMTEFVTTIIEWAQTQESIRALIASTDKSNRASNRVLEKNHFFIEKETDDTFHWRFITRH
jgi:ribosomal-protein-alanine N-acetyltransferase